MTALSDLIARDPDSGRFCAVPVERRFWDKVVKTEHCWVWTGATVKERGQLFHRGRLDLAPRVSWELHRGLIPDGLWVLHTCDNPACVNPDHLYLGNRQDNGKDAAERGRTVAILHPELLPRGKRHGRQTKPERTARGSRHGCAKLDENTVETIRKSAAPNKTLAALYYVSRDTIEAIKARRRWKHVP